MEKGDSEVDGMLALFQAESYGLSLSKYLNTAVSHCARQAVVGETSL
jgi:hypothetical protein